MNRKNRLGPVSKGKLALLSSTALFAFAMPQAYAQDADAADEAAETSDEVVVKGIRRALQTAREIKRDSDTFVDSITASDVTQLPDLSVAEALSRVPGVVTNRFELGGSDGDFPSPEGSGNIVRGLQYVSSQFNGRDAFSANGGRALEWASIPPELIGAVDVFKSQTADQIEGGIAGTVNLRTLEPFDRNGRVAVFVVEGIYTDLAKEFAPGGSVVLGDRWNTESGEFGLLGSFSISNLKSGINGFQYGQLLPRPHPDPTLTSTVALPGGWQARDVLFDRGRESYYLAGQWRSPDDSMQLTLKAIRVDNKTESDERTFEFFTDGESWQNWEYLGADNIVTPFESAGIPQCNGSNDTLFLGVGSCEPTIAVDGGLFEAGVVSNGLRDWLGDDGTLGTSFSGLAVREVNQSRTQDFSANFKWRATDQLFLEFDAQYTKASATLDRLWAGTNVFADYAFDFTDIENPEVELFLTGSRLATWGGAYRGADPGVPTSLSDPATSYLLFAADEFQDNTGDLYAFRADATYEFDNEGWFNAVKFGARHSNREQINRSAGLNWAAIAAPWGGGYLPFSNITQDGTYEVWDFADFGRGGIFQGPNTGIVYPSRELLNDYEAFVDFVDNEPLINTPGTYAPDWNPLKRNGVVDYSRGVDGNVQEKSWNAYLRVDFGNDFDNGMSVDGNVGVRYVKTSITGGGVLTYIPIEDTAGNPGDPVPSDFIPETVAFSNSPSEVITIGQDYTYWLPSFNMKWNLNDEMLMRFGVSKSITRPNIADLNASRSGYFPLSYITDQSTTPPSTVGIESQGLIFNGGNPLLEPIEAFNIDVSFEYYFGEDGQFSVSYFHKDLDNIIVYGESNLGSFTLDGETLPIDFRGNTNLNDGSIDGVEVAFQQFFTNLPGILGNTGLQANYTYIQSSTTPLPAFEDANGDGLADDFLTTYRWGIDELLGLSDHSYNIIGLYQTDKFEGRIAYNWRSQYYSSYRDFITGNPIIQDDIGFLDASIRYNLTDNFQVSLQGANLLDTKAVALQQIDQAGQTFGRSVFTNDRRFEISMRYAF